VGLDDVVDRGAVGDECLPALAVGEVLEVRVALLGAAKAVGLVDGDHAEPGEDGDAIRLAAQQDRPGGLAGVFDELKRRVDDARDGPQEVVLVAAVQLRLVAARPRSRAGWGRRALDSVGGLHAPRSGRDSRRLSRFALRPAGRLARWRARQSGAGSSPPTERASAANGPSSGCLDGSRLVSTRRAVARVDGLLDPPRDRVDGLRVFADGVKGAVFAPAGDVGDRLAAHVEPH
jgi:hypothetical protein